MADLAGWAGEVARLLRPSGQLFVYEAHPAVVLWTWDEDWPRVRNDRDHFARDHVNDTFPARRAVEWQWTLGEIVTTVAAAGMEILHLGEYPEPFWRAGGVAAAAWSGRLPSSFALLARRVKCTAAARCCREACRWCPGSRAAGMLLGCRVAAHYNELHEPATERPPE